MACGIKPKTILILANYRFKNHLRNMSGVNLEKQNSAKQQNNLKKTSKEDNSVALVDPARSPR